MRNPQRRVAILGKRFSALLEFGRLLNGLGLFNVTLRSDPQDLLELLEAGERFDLLIHDDFDHGRDGDTLQAIAWYEAIDRIVLAADVNSRERRQLLDWAQEQALPAAQVLQLPVRVEDLQRMVTAPRLQDAAV